MATWPRMRIRIRASSIWRTAIGQLHPQLGQGDDRRLHGRDEPVRLRSGGRADSGVLAAVSESVQAGIGNAGGSAGACAVSGDVVQRASGDLPHVPYAGCGGVLQPRGSVGSGEDGQQAGRSRATPVSPTYVVATLPDSDTPEFMLITPFTPANKDNLIGVMYARCDGAHLGELVFEQLSKQNIIYGPMQIDARINQDQNISKDLTLVEPAGVAGAARADAGAADRQQFPICGADIHSGVAGEHAAIEEGGAGDGQPAGVCGYL